MNAAEVQTMTATDLPDWFDLDTVVPKQLRDDLEHADAALRELLPELANRLDRAHRAYRAVFEEVNTYEVRPDWYLHEHEIIDATYGGHLDLVYLFIDLVQEVEERDMRDADGIT